jgi:hypothetical protein
MTSEVPRVVPIDARHAQKRNTAGLTESERQLLLDEIAQIAAELNELQRRAAQIAGRVAPEASVAAQPSSRANRSA